MTDGRGVTSVMVLSRDQWSTGWRRFNAPTPVYFGCRWCGEPLRYEGLLTADGYAVEPMKCGRCKAEFGLFLHGWRGRDEAIESPAPVRRGPAIKCS